MRNESYEHWSDAAWRNVDIGSVVLQYGRLLAYEYRGWLSATSSVDSDDLVHEYYVIAYPRLRRQHERHHDIAPERRNQFIYGTCRSIAATAFKRALDNLLPLRRPDRDPGLGGVNRDEAEAHAERLHSRDASPARGMLHAAPTAPPDVALETYEEGPRQMEELRLQQAIEYLRPLLQPMQYRILYRRVMDGYSVDDIAAEFDLTRKRATGRMYYLRRIIRQHFAKAEDGPR